MPYKRSINVTDTQKTFVIYTVGVMLKGLTHREKITVYVVFNSDSNYILNTTRVILKSLIHRHS